MNFIWVLALCLIVGAALPPWFLVMVPASTPVFVMACVVSVACIAIEIWITFAAWKETNEQEITVIKPQLPRR
jgi:Na+/glutamate symporter